MSLSYRDIHLLDGKHFFEDGWCYRKILGLDFVRGLSKAPALGVPLLAHKRTTLCLQLQDLRVRLETQRDFISFDYSYGFEDEPKRRNGGAESGIRVEGGFGMIDVSPAGYCDLTIMEVGPNGKGRITSIIDLRSKREYMTSDRGKLKVYARKAVVGWFDQLDKLLAFLGQQTADTVEISHAE